MEINKDFEKLNKEVSLVLDTPESRNAGSYIYIAMERTDNEQALSLTILNSSDHVLYNMIRGMLNEYREIGKVVIDAVIGHLQDIADDAYGEDMNEMEIPVKNDGYVN